MKKLLAFLLISVLILYFFVYRANRPLEIHSKPAAQELSFLTVLSLKVSYFIKSDSIAAFRLMEYYWADDLVESCVWYNRAQKSGYKFIGNEQDFYTSICPVNNERY